MDNGQFTISIVVLAIVASVWGLLTWWFASMEASQSATRVALCVGLFVPFVVTTGIANFFRAVNPQHLEHKRKTQIERHRHLEEMARLSKSDHLHMMIADLNQEARADE